VLKKRVANEIRYIGAVLKHYQGVYFLKITFIIFCYFLILVLLGSCHKRQRRKRQSVTAKREKSQTPKVLTAILTLPNLT